MTCPKTLRNGPCGGVRADGGCEVKPEMRCVWLKGYERAPQRLPLGARSSTTCARRSTTGSGHVVVGELRDEARPAHARRAGMPMSRLEDTLRARAGS